MKARNVILFFVFLVALFVACQKNNTQAPAITTPNHIAATPVQSFTATNTPRTAATTTVTITPAPPTPPYTDTFFGSVYEGDWGLSSIPDTVAYIYAYHPNLDSILFSSNYFNHFPYSYGSGFSAYGFGQYYLINATNYYWSGDPRDSSDAGNFRIVGDSLYYNNSQPAPPGEMYLLYFTGKKIK